MSYSKVTSAFSNHRADIDGLRGLAVLSVIGFHAFPLWIRGGFIGVDIFFVISGFLISSIILSGLENNSFSLSTFYAKRIKRILPALLIVLIFCFTFGWFALFPNEYKQLGKHIASGSSFISNFILWGESGYFDGASESKPLLHLWSLGIEEQFYLIWPLMLWFAWKKNFNVIFLIALIIAISFLLNLQNITTNPISTFYLPHTRIWELLLGSLITCLIPYRNNLISNRLFAQIASVLGCGLIAYSLYAFNKQTVFPSYRALLPTLGTGLIIYAGNDAWINKKLLSNRMLMWFGLISFPLYLWHWPLLSFASIMQDQSEVLTRIVRFTIIFLSIVLAWCTYKYVEKPIRFNNSWKRLKVISLILSLCITGSLGLFICLQDGFKWRFKDSSSLFALIDTPLPRVIGFDCSAEPQLKIFGARCQSSKPMAPDILFIGDSHADHYRNGIWENLTKNSVKLIYEPSCLPFASDYFLKGECKAKYNALISYIESNSNIKKIYISGYWAYLMTGGFGETGKNWRHAKSLDEEGARSFIKNGKNFINHVLKTNKEIVFLKDIPDLNFNIKTCFKTRPLLLPYQSTRKDCSIDYKQYQQRARAYDMVVNELLNEFPQIKVYDPRPVFCKGSKCMARDEEFPYYTNGDHLNRYGANLVIKDMLKKTV